MTQIQINAFPRFNTVLNNFLRYIARHVKADILLLFKVKKIILSRTTILTLHTTKSTIEKLLVEILLIYILGIFQSAMIIKVNQTTTLYRKITLTLLQISALITKNKVRMNIRKVIKPIFQLTIW